GADLLQRYEAVGDRLPRLEYHPHAALAQLLDQHVAAELAWQVCRGGGRVFAVRSTWTGRGARPLGVGARRGRGGGAMGAFLAWKAFPFPESQVALRRGPRLGQPARERRGVLGEAAAVILHYRRLIPSAEPFHLDADQLAGHQKPQVGVETGREGLDRLGVA